MSPVPFAPTIQLEPKDALLQVLKSVKEHAPHTKSKFNVSSTWTGVLRQCADYVAPYDASIELFHPKTPAHRARLQALAKEFDASSSSSSQDDVFPGLRIRNAGDLNSIPAPVRASSSYRQQLKENIRTLEKPVLDPYIKTVPLFIESKKLATLCGLLNLSAIDGTDQDLSALIRSSEMLVDTGAQVSLITDDLLPLSFRDYLLDPIHDPYRSEDGTMVQVDVRFSFADQQINMACIFHVVSRTRIPNKRIGVILGQHSCLDHMVYTLTPRLFIPSISEDDIWGDLTVHRYIDSTGQAVDLS